VCVEWSWWWREEFFSQGEQHGSCILRGVDVMYLVKDLGICSAARGGSFS